MNNNERIGFEQVYTDVLKKYLNSSGDWFKKKTRNSDKETLCIPNLQIKFYNPHTNFPKMTVRPTYPKLAANELIWFLLGRTDVQWLRDRKVNYWNEFESEDGTIGKSYGHQFRNFNGCDNLARVITNIIKNPFDRRHVLNLWNPNDLDDMVLPPCCYAWNFLIEDTGLLHEGSDVPLYRLHVTMNMRSLDIACGLPYDAMQAAWFSWFLCSIVNTSPDAKFLLVEGSVTINACDAHIYDENIYACSKHLTLYKKHFKISQGKRYFITPVKPSNAIPQTRFMIDERRTYNSVKHRLLDKIAEEFDKFINEGKLTVEASGYEEVKFSNIPMKLVP